MKSRFNTAREVFETYPELREGITAAPSELAPLPFLLDLLKSKTPEDAITFCPYILDRREAVWWASQCCRAMGCPSNREEDVALLTAEAWIRDPEEHRRVAAFKLGFNGNHSIPGIWVALAAGSAGATMIINGRPGPPVPPGMTARSSRNAVLIALARMPLKDRNKNMQDCVDFCKKLLERP